MKRNLPKLASPLDLLALVESAPAETIDSATKKVIIDSLADQADADPGAGNGNRKARRSAWAWMKQAQGRFIVHALKVLDRQHSQRVSAYKKRCPNAESFNPKKGRAQQTKCTPAQEGV